MNIARVGLLVVAVAAAGAAAFLVRTLTHKPAHETAMHEAPPPAVSHVLVAARALEPGGILKAGDLRWQEWPQGGISPNFMTEESAPKALSNAVGSTIRAHVDLGEPITSTKLVKASGAGYMAAMLDPGMRAISTKIDDDSAASGFILPGDHVDVILTRRADRSSGGSGDGYESRTILSDVKVLAIGQAVETKDGDKVVQGRTATLELAPRQTELLALAGAMGNLTLTLRSAAQGGITGALPKSGLDGATDGAIRVVRYAHPSKVMPVASAESGDGQ